MTVDPSLPSNPPRRDRPPGRLPPSAMSAAALACALLALASYPARADLFTAIAGRTAASDFGPFVGSVAELGLLILVAMAGVLALWCRLRSRQRFWLLVAAGAGVIAAYASSEGTKLLVTEVRPCRAVEVATVLSCPGAGDWSWPSNHSVLAAAFATACILTAPRLAWAAVPAAAAVAASRVGAGVHYVHDVLSGLALGIIVVVLVVLALRPVLDRLPARATAEAEGVGSA